MPIDKDHPAILQDRIPIPSSSDSAILPAVPAVGSYEACEVLLIGASILDVLVHPASEDVFRTGSYEAEEIRMSTGGDALNEATILARMGRKTALNTVIGRDHAGSFLLRHFEACGICVQESCISDTVPTGINIVLIDEAGERHFLTNPKGSLRRITLHDISMPFPDAIKIVCFASMFVFPELGVRELKAVFAQVKKQEKILCVDITKRKNNETAQDMAPALAFVDYLFPNEEEAMLLTGSMDAESAAEVLFDCGVKNVIIKCGSRGCYIKNSTEAFYVAPTRPAICIDSTGAGDSFAAGFINGLLQGLSLRKCAELANEYGGKCIRQIGATVWTESRF